MKINYKKELKFLIKLLYTDRPCGMSGDEFHKIKYDHIYRIAKQIDWKKEEKPNVVGL